MKLINKTEKTMLIKIFDPNELITNHQVSENYSNEIKVREELFPIEPCDGYFERLQSRLKEVETIEEIKESKLLLDLPSCKKEMRTINILGEYCSNKKQIIYYQQTPELIEIVKIHERFHAVHHLTQDDKGKIWESFGSTPSFYLELLAQLFTYIYLRDTCSPSLDVFLDLNKNQPFKYQTFKIFKHYDQQQAEDLYWIIRNKDKRNYKYYALEKIKNKTNTIMKRELSDTFIDDLKSGILKEILEYIHKDNTLDLEIRAGYVNIYYRGGNILRIREVAKNKYEFEFDPNYFSSSNNHLKDFKANKDCDLFFPKMKQAMDFYFSKHRKEEREYQQLVVRENNYSSIANGTDYFIIDIEYDNHAKGRFDLVAVEWLSKASHRKLSKSKEPKLVVIEMKYGDKALSGYSGMKKHLEDFHSFVSNDSILENFKQEMLTVFSQKRALGLIPCLSSTENSNQIVQFAKDIELAFLIANHDPASTKLKTELNNCGATSAKFITSNFMGYGIYIEGVFNLEEFYNKHSNQF